MRRLFIGLLIVAAVVIGGGIIANTAYQAGLSTAFTTAAANAPAGTVVTPVAPGPYGYPYGYGYGFGPGWGWGHGFSIFGFLGTLLVIFIIIGLLRAVFWRGRGWGGGGWGSGYGPGKWGGPGRWGDPEHDPRNRFHQTFEDWHREAHGGSTGSSGSTGSTGSAPSQGSGSTSS
jgi:hypothetical protein